MEQKLYKMIIDDEGKALLSVRAELVALFSELGVVSNDGYRELKLSRLGHILRIRTEADGAIVLGVLEEFHRSVVEGGSIQLTEEGQNVVHADLGLAKDRDYSFDCTPVVLCGCGEDDGEG